jgi:hypothetical protein
MTGGVDTGVETGVIAAGIAGVVAGATGVVGAGVVWGASPPVQPAATMARMRHPAMRRVKILNFFKGSVTAVELSARNI